MTPQAEQMLVCRRSQFSLELWKWDAHVERYELNRAYPIAIGMAAYKTRPGVYRIESRAKDPDWTMPDSPWVEEELRGSTIPGGDERNPIKSRWLGFFEGAGIHGTADFASLGTAASHGCLRMAVPDVEELFPKVPLGTILVIH